ncbi:D-2-hydroxyacid dehydrogenase [Chitinimonas lacunae]|uniref:D-2-hydroxyacid dehydrogenase n=1 Tax=Chitinimonas lacunae TaxID=1963018 RepID=A0ABV8MMT0_9NEIS
MLSIVFLDRASLPVALPSLVTPHQWRDFDATDPSRIVERASEAEVIITNKVPLDAATLARLPRLRLIAVAATGTNHIDLAAARERAVVVCNIQGYADDSVAEHAIMLMLALAKQLPAYQQDARLQWARSASFCHFGAPIIELAGRTLCLVGSGALGRRTGEIATALRMRVIHAERRDASVVRPGYTAFHAALAEADVVSLHCPLTPATANLIGATELARMRPGALLINTARGGLVDSDALLAALQSGHLGGAGLDVLPEEPPPENHPLLRAALPNLLITPHIAWASHAAMSRMADQLIDNIDAFAAGKPLRQII